jgi:branched-chain amino acid transport system ATP-binding protein
VLEIAHLNGGWGPTLVVEDFGLVVAEGETVAVIGRNGVGKSTLLELLVGRAQRRSGSIRLRGGELSMLPIHLRARGGLGYVPQGREVFPSLTVREHLEIAERPGTWTIARVVEMFPRLGERAASFGNQLSGGEQQMLAIARALLGNPLVLLMDEPFEGLAPIIVEELVRSIRAIVRDGALTVLLVEQRVDIALELSDRCVVMDRGRGVFEGASSKLAEDEAGLTALMGLVH